MRPNNLGPPAGRLTLPATLAVWLGLTAAAAAQQTLPVYVDFEYRAASVSNLYADKAAAERRLANDLHPIFDQGLRVWTYRVLEKQATELKQFPRLLVWIDEGDAGGLTLHLWLLREAQPPRDLLAFPLSKPGFNSYTAESVEAAVKKALRGEFAPEDKWLGYVKRLKDVPLGRLPDRALPAVLANQRRSVLPLRFDAYKLLASSKFKIECQDDMEQKVSLYCKGEGHPHEYKPDSMAATVFPGIRVWHEKMGEDLFKDEHLPLLVRLKGKRFFLEEYLPYNEEEAGLPAAADASTIKEGQP